MKITIVAGSQRANSQSEKVAQYLGKIAQSSFEQVNILDLHAINLPLWNENIGKGGEEWKPWKEIAEGLSTSDAFIFITPEWHGMATPALKNFLMLSTAKEMAHKPALAVSVSASVNGVYPISELRLTGSKNNHVCFLPDHLIFRDVSALLDQNLHCTKPHFDERCRYTMTLLEGYARALGPVHRDMLEAGKAFIHGM
ncbi:NAD(P)H-dependent oxidoreductase [Veronia pacifica]|uniref:Reductase n=1 Tax=Veronia pacifica TaxID=1080227 RepID=A0A1C3ERN2_9GAMM|nr:NAD(P)H-dependent oxidoreductase [Veronia pacifica]ODA35912.1 reductase [Veronia pacifica]